MEKLQQIHKRRGVNIPAMLPVMELLGQNRLLIENHLGVIFYSVKEIEVKLNGGRVIVSGEDLRLIEMSRVKLVICGRIDSLQLLGR